MKTNKRTYILAALFFLSLFSGNFGYSQGAKKIDSIIKVNSSQIYENPDKVIAVGKQIVNQAGNDIDSKIKGYKIISDAYSSKRDYQKSLENVIKAEQLLDKTSNKLLKISIIVKAGIQYHQLKIYDKSMQFLDQSEKMCLEYPARDSVKIYLGINYILRGFIYKEKLNCDIAIAYFNKGINEIITIKDKSNLSKVSIAKYNIANCYILMSENDLAIQSFKESIVYAKITNAVSLKAFALKGLAQVYTLQSQYKEAIEQLLEARSISSNVNDLVLDQEIYKGLAENYLALNDWEKYKNYYSKYLNTQSKLKESERKSISNLLIEKEKEVNNTINQNFSNFIFWFWFFIMSIALIVFIISNQKSKKTISDLSTKIDTMQKEDSSH
ncbi:tetratricopeptide repeat protein [Flavobacterium sp.]|jgi:tetratricopeptide (TPR) repeat protein|uniref:tetratricopeptide repeat protein n=1 Tax=Flavobacterium sp. TaxID=239 RepID=UPI0037BEBCD1